MPVVESSDQVLPLLSCGDQLETDDGPGTLVSVQFQTAQYNGSWELEPPSLIVELDSGQTIHTCLCSITLPGTKLGTKLLHREFKRLWPPKTDGVPEDSAMLIPEGSEDPPDAAEPTIREGTEKEATMRNRRTADRDITSIEDLVEFAVGSAKEFDGLDEAEDYRHEAIEAALPIYYAQMVDLLRDTDLMHYDVGETFQGGTLVNAIQSTMYEAISEGLHNRWDEVEDHYAGR